MYMCVSGGTKCWFFGKIWHALFCCYLHFEIRPLALLLMIYHFAENFNVYQHAKNKLLYSFLSWDIAKILHTCDFQYFRYASPQSKIWQYQFAEIYYVYLHKNRIHPSLFSWDSAKILQTCHFGYFGHVWLWLPKTMVPGWRKLWCSFSCKKSNSSFIVFLKYCYYIASLLFWILWTCLATSTKNNSINL